MLLQKQKGKWEENLTWSCSLYWCWNTWVTGMLQGKIVFTGRRTITILDWLILYYCYYYFVCLYVCHWHFHMWKTISLFWRYTNTCFNNSAHHVTTVEAPCLLSFASTPTGEKKCKLTQCNEILIFTLPQPACMPAYMMWTEPSQSACSHLWQCIEHREPSEGSPMA